MTKHIMTRTRAAALVLLIGVAGLGGVAAAQQAEPGQPVDLRGLPAEHGGAHAAPAAHGDPTAHFNYLNFGYRGKDTEGGKLDTTENPDDEPMSPPFLAMVLNFALLLGLLAWKVRPGSRRFAERRHGEIKSALDEAAKLRAEAQAKVDEYTAKVKQAEGEVEKLLADIRADAVVEKQRIIAAAEEQAAALQRDAELRIAAAIDRARRELERDVVNAAVTITEKVLREKATTADHNKLIDGFLGDVARAPRSASEERT